VRTAFRQAEAGNPPSQLRFRRIASCEAPGDAEVSQDQIVTERVALVDGHMDSTNAELTHNVMRTGPALTSTVAARQRF